MNVADSPTVSTASTEMSAGVQRSAKNSNLNCRYRGNALIEEPLVRIWMDCRYPEVILRLIARGVLWSQEA